MSEYLVQFAIQTKNSKKNENEEAISISFSSAIFQIPQFLYPIQVIGILCQVIWSNKFSLRRLRLSDRKA